jgi:hypothetical protein
MLGISIVLVISTASAVFVAVYFIFGVRRLVRYIKDEATKEQKRSLIVGLIMFLFYPFLKEDPRAEAWISIYALLVYQGLMGALWISPLIALLLKKKE